MNYLNINGGLLYSREVRKLGATDIYKTKIDLFGQYVNEKNQADEYSFKIDYDLNQNIDEIQFYILLDYMTYVPFGKAGRDALENKFKEEKTDKTVADYKFEKASEILKEKNIKVTPEQLSKIKQFFEQFDNQEFKLDAVGFATVVRRVSEYLENMIVMNKISGTIAKSQELSKILEELEKKVKQENKKSFKIEDYIDLTQDIKELDDKQKEFIYDQTGMIFAQPGMQE